MTMDLSIVITASPAWAVAAANVIYWTLMAGLALGLALIYVPVPRPVRVVEAGFWIDVLAMLVLVALFVILAGQLNPLAGLLSGGLLVAYIVYWIPASHRTFDVQVESTIAASPDAIFTLIGDPAAMVRLHATVDRAFIEDGPPVRRGSRIHARLRASRIEGVDEVVEFDPPLRYADRMAGTPYTRVAFTLNPVPEGTHLVCEEHNVLSYPNAILSGYLKSYFARRLRMAREAWFERLQAEVEQPTRQGG